MKKQLLHIIILLLLCGGAFGQAGMWTWMKGTSGQNSIGSYGIKGVPANSNTPPALYESCSWQDNLGNFWIYGGYHGSIAAGDTLTGNLNDLWKFNPTTNQWTWIKGTATPDALGDTGVQGVPSIYNQPSCRGWGTPCWTDLNGNFWMYSGIVGWDDLWKYNVSTNEWTWMKGNINFSNAYWQNTTPVYGVKGVPSILNTPGSRAETAATWVDNTGNLWLFGGNNHIDFKNDLWKYDVSTNMWTWMSGDSVSNTIGSYGIKNIFSATNLPSSRCCYSVWKDNKGKFYLFGGFSNYSGSCGYVAFNDVWCFNPQNNLWAWVGGSSSLNDTGHNVGACVEDTNNIPWNTWENRATSKDKFGNVYMFGGIASACSTYVHQNNELWVFKECTKNWVFLKSGPYNGIYGTKGVPSINNSPHAQQGSVSWIDLLGNFWIFGGTYNGNSHNLNALWKYTPDSNCNLCNVNNQVPFILISSTDTSFCEKQCINFTDLSTNSPTSWQWHFPGAIPDTSSLQNPSNVCYNIYGSYDVTLIACNAAGCDTLHLTNFINCYKNPTDSIFQSNDTLYSLPAYSYQWYETTNGIILGANNQYFVPQQAGSFYCLITDSVGCAGSSGTIVIASNPLTTEGGEIKVVPNPFNENITITFHHKNVKKSSVLIKNVLGQNVYSINISPTGVRGSLEIDLSFLPNGIYLLEVVVNDFRYIKKIVKS